jgi:hypothetical protein
MDDYYSSRIPEFQLPARQAATRDRDRPGGRLRGSSDISRIGGLESQSRARTEFAVGAVGSA